MSLRKPYHMPFRNLIPPFTLTGCQENLRETIRYLLARTIETSSLPTNSSRAMASKFDVPCYIVLCTIYRTFCVRHLKLHSRLNVFAFNIQLWLMQHSSFRFRHSTFLKQQSTFLIRSSSSVECTFIFSHPTFSIWPLSFRFRYSTLGIVLASFRIRHSTFRIGLLPAGQQAMEIVGSIDLTHPCSNDGRESVDRPSSGEDSGAERGRSPGFRCTVFEGGECCPTDCLS